MRNREAESRMALVAMMLARAVDALLPPGMRFCLIVLDPEQEAWGAQGSGAGADCLEIARMAIRTYDGTLTDPDAPPPATPDRSAN